MTEAKFSFTTKVGGDLFTVRGDSVQEFVNNLNGAVDAVGNAQNLQAVSTAISGLGAGTQVVSQEPAPQAAPVQQYAPAAPQPQAAAPAQAGVPTPQCNHGARKYVTSKPGAARAWSAWMCPTPQGAPDKCEPVWI